MSIQTSTAPSAEPIVDLDREAARVGAAFRLATTGERSPELKHASSMARLDLVAAIIAMDEADDVPGRHNLQEQADVEAALRAYGQALADLVRGEAS